MYLRGTRTGQRWLTILLTVTLAPLLVWLGACDETYDVTKECGYPGNCCWADGTCNRGFVCNQATKLCEVGGDRGRADLPARPDGSKGEGKVNGKEAGVPDLAVIDRGSKDVSGEKAAPVDLAPAGPE